MSRIALLVEGQAEDTALKPALKAFLDRRCEAGHKPKVRLDVHVVGSDLFNEGKGKGLVRRVARGEDLLGVVALVDVKAPPTSTRQSFADAAEAIAYLRGLGSDIANFHAHAAQHDLEAWLLPYWHTARAKAGVPQTPPPHGQPEHVNHLKPPSWHLQGLYRLGKKKYSKPRDGADILHGQDLTVAATACPQFKAFLNTLLTLTECPVLP